MNDNDMTHDQIADRLDQTDDVHTRLAGREDAMVRMSYALRAALEGDKATVARHFDRAMAEYEASDAFDSSAAFVELRDDIQALLDNPPHDAPVRDSAAEEVGVSEAQVQLVLDHLRGCREDTELDYVPGHHALTEDEWQDGVEELRRRGHVISETFQTVQRLHHEIGYSLDRGADEPPARDADDEAATTHHTVRDTGVEGPSANADEAAADLKSPGDRRWSSPPASSSGEAVGGKRELEPEAESSDFKVAEPPDGGRNPAPDVTHAAVSSAERAVLELRGRRALAEQNAQARARDARTTAWQTTNTAAAGDTRQAARGPVLSAFDD